MLSVEQADRDIANTSEVSQTFGYWEWLVSVKSHAVSIFADYLPACVHSSFTVRHQSGVVAQAGDRSVRTPDNVDRVVSAPGE